MNDKPWMVLCPDCATNWRFVNEEQATDFAEEHSESKEGHDSVEIQHRP